MHTTDVIENARALDPREAQARLDASCVAVGAAYKRDDAADFNRILDSPGTRQNLLANFHLVLAVRGWRREIGSERDALDRHYKALADHLGLSPVNVEHFLDYGVISYVNACVMCRALKVGLGRMLYEQLDRDALVREQVGLISA